MTVPEPMSRSKDIMPPLNALKAFDAVARLGSMNRAASELNIAPSSVTQHIRNLEDFLGTDLFVRGPNAISLNDRGKDYAAEVRGAFDTLLTATGEIAADVRSEPLRISCVPTLAGPWIAEQLAEIERAFPDVAIRCDFSPVPVDFEADEVDLALRYGSGDYPGAVAELLHVDHIAPVCTRETARQIETPGDLARLTRIDSAESAPDGHSLWAYWAAQAVGADLAGLLRAPARLALQSSAFSVEMLRATPAVAILEHAIVRDRLSAGELVAPLAMWVPAPLGYHVLSSKRRPLRPAARRLKVLVTRTAQDHFSPAP